MSWPRSWRAARRCGPSIASLLPRFHPGVQFALGDVLDRSNVEGTRPVITVEHIGGVGPWR
jgi:hypothetical protein